MRRPCGRGRPGIPEKHQEAGVAGGGYARWEVATQSEWGWRVGDIGSCRALRATVKTKGVKRNFCWRKETAVYSLCRKELRAAGITSVTSLSQVRVWALASVVFSVDSGIAIYRLSDLG